MGSVRTHQVNLRMLGNHTNTLLNSGAAIAYGLYNQFQDSDNRISFGVYMLFIGVAMAITVC